MDRRSLIVGLTGAAGLAALGGLGALSACQPQREPTDRYGRTRLRFAIDGPAQASHGGFYQAVASGAYSRRDLNVEIIPGGPTVDVPQLLSSGQVELGLAANCFTPMRLTAESAPVSVVAAFFQKDPQVVIAHPDPPPASIGALTAGPFILPERAVSEVWVWLKAIHGFSDDQIRLATGDLQAFLDDPQAVQIGRLTQEPYDMELASGAAPAILLLADDNYPSYGNMLMVPDGLIRDNRSVVARFIEASVEGWRAWLDEDPAPADTLIRRANPDMTAEHLAWARAQIIANQVVVSEGGRIGDMSAARWQAFFETTSGAGVYARDIDWRSAFTLDFLRS